MKIVVVTVNKKMSIIFWCVGKYLFLWKVIGILCHESINLLGCHVYIVGIHI